MAASKVLLKVVVLGGQRVGKTQLLRSYAKKKFEAKHVPTTVANLVPLEIRSKGKVFNLQMWDMPGDNKAMAGVDSRNLAANACVLVYDISQTKSVKALANRLRAFNDACESDGSKKKPHIIVIGNKSDVDAETPVPLSKVVKFFKEKGITEVFEVSSKTGEGVEEAFKSLLVSEDESFLDMSSLTADMDALNNRRRPKGKATVPCLKSEWLPDAEASDCGSCGANFSLFNRRHHCRACGDIFCNACCSQKWEYGGEPCKVCDECYSDFTTERSVMAGGK